MKKVATPALGSRAIPSRRRPKASSFVAKKLTIRPGSRDKSSEDGDIAELFTSLRAVMNDIKEFRAIIGMASEANQLARVLQQRDADGLSLLLVACRYGHLDALYTMIESGAVIDAITESGNSGLHLLAKLQNQSALGMYPQLLGMMIKKGAKLDLRNEVGECPIHCACANANFLGAKLLIEAKCAVNPVSRKLGQTPLHYAVYQNHLELCDLLLKNGALIVANDNSQTALDVAVEFWQGDVAKLLENAVLSRSQSQSARTTGEDNRNEDAILTRTNPGSLISTADCLWSRYTLDFFPKRHFAYFSPKCIGVVLSRPPHRGLLFSPHGFEMFTVPEEKLMLFRDQETAEQLLKFLDAEPRFDSGWRRFTQPTVSNEMFLLYLEAKLCPPRRISIGVVFGTSEQRNKEEMLANTELDERVMSSLGTRYVVGDDDEGVWQADGIYDEGQVIYCTSFRGFEVIYHVAPLMSDSATRAHIGNDIVLLYVLPSDGHIERSFQGQVNSIALIAKVLPDGRISLDAFYKSTIKGFTPVTPPEPVDARRLKKYVLANSINGIYHVRNSPPYSNNRRDILEAELWRVTRLEDGLDADVQDPVHVLDPVSGEDAVEDVVEAADVSGYLYKRKDKKGRSAWLKRWCVLTKSSLHYFESRGGKKLGSLLMTSILKAELKEDMLCLSCGPTTSYEFKSDEDIHSWYFVLRMRFRKRSQSVSSATGRPALKSCLLQMKVKGGKTRPKARWVALYPDCINVFAKEGGALRVTFSLNSVRVSVDESHTKMLVEDGDGVAQFSAPSAASDADLIHGWAMAALEAQRSLREHMGSSKFLKISGAVVKKDAPAAAAPDVKWPRFDPEDASSAPFVSAAVSNLMSRALSKRGIFRAPADDEASVEELCSQWKSNLRVTVGELVHVDVHVIAGALKRYFRAQSPLIPFDQYEAFLAAAPLDVNAKLQYLHALVHSRLPPGSRAVLCLMLKLLHAVQLEWTANTVDAEDLAVVFAPAWLVDKSGGSPGKHLEQRVRSMKQVQASAAQGRRRHEAAMHRVSLVAFMVEYGDKLADAREPAEVSVLLRQTSVVGRGGARGFFDSVSVEEAQLFNSDKAKRKLLGLEPASAAHAHAHGSKGKKSSSEALADLF